MQSKSTIKIVCSMIFEKKLHKMVFPTSVGLNLVQFGGSFGFLRFSRFEVRFLGPK